MGVNPEDLPEVTAKVLENGASVDKILQEDNRVAYEGSPTATNIRDALITLGLMKAS